MQKRIQCISALYAFHKEFLKWERDLHKPYFFRFRMMVD